MTTHKKDQKWLQRIIKVATLRVTQVNKMEMCRSKSNISIFNLLSFFPLKFSTYSEKSGIKIKRERLEKTELGKEEKWTRLWVRNTGIRHVYMKFLWYHSHNIWRRMESSGWWGNCLVTVFSHLEPVKHL